jgi:hypothetical protein
MWAKNEVETMSDIYETKIEWLRGRWMVEHGYQMHSDTPFVLFEAPDLTAEEIKDCAFDDLQSLVEFVRERTKPEIVRAMREFRA